MIRPSALLVLALASRLVRGSHESTSDEVALGQSLHLQGLPVCLSSLGEISSPVGPDRSQVLLVLLGRRSPLRLVLLVSYQ